MMSRNEQELNTDLYLALTRLARKQSNFSFGSRLIFEQLNYFKSILNLEYNPNDLSEYLKSFNQDLQDNIHNLNSNLKIYLAEFNLESAKFINSFENNNNNNSIEILSKSILNFLFSNCFNFKLNEIYSRSILTLCKWLSINQSDSNILNNNNLYKILSLVKQSNLDLNKQDSNQEESIIGNMLDLATTLSPKLAKSWYSLANWCYKSARKGEDKENQTIQDLIPAHVSQEEKILFKIYSQIELKV